MTPAERWGALLRQYMTKRRIRVGELSRLSGIAPNCIIDWRGGHHLPTLAYAAIVADALACPRLAEFCVELRTVECAYCERTFVRDNRGGKPRRYCSDKCCNSHYSEVSRPEREGLWGKVHSKWRSRALKAHVAVAAFCHSCEPEGRCRTPDCELRAVSPLPLARKVVA